MGKKIMSNGYLFGHPVTIPDPVDGLPWLLLSTFAFFCLHFYVSTKRKKELELEKREKEEKSQVELNNLVWVTGHSLESFCDPLISKISDYISSHLSEKPIDFHLYSYRSNGQGKNSYCCYSLDLMDSKGTTFVFFISVTGRFFFLEKDLSVERTTLEIETVDFIDAMFLIQNVMMNLGIKKLEFDDFGFKGNSLHS